MHIPDELKHFDPKEGTEQDEQTIPEENESEDDDDAVEVD